MAINSKIVTNKIFFCKVGNNGKILEKNIRYGNVFYTDVFNKTLYSSFEVEELQSLKSFLQEHNLEILLYNENGKYKEYITPDYINRIKSIAVNKKNNLTLFNKMVMVSNNIINNIFESLGINQEDGIALKATTLDKINSELSILMSLSLLKDSKILLEKKCDVFSSELLILFNKYGIKNIEKLNDICFSIYKNGMDIIATEPKQKKSYAMSKI